MQALADVSRSALCCHSNETRAPITSTPFAFLPKSRESIYFFFCSDKSVIPGTYLLN